MAENSFVSIFGSGGGGGSAPASCCWIVQCGTGVLSTNRICATNVASGCFSTTFGTKNTSSGNYAVVSGGICNTSSGLRSINVGGFKNLNNSFDGFIGGGNCNAICNTTSGCYAYGAVVVGGVGNNTFGGTWSLASCCFSVAPTICTAGQYSFVGGGFQNKATACFSSVVAGNLNSIISCGVCSYIGGGQGNCICSNSGGGVINGGVNNMIFGIANNTIGGGCANCVCNGISSNATIGGGRQNKIYSTYSFNYQTIYSGSTIGGGYANTINESSSGYCNTYFATHTIGGGFGNTAGYNSVSAYINELPSFIGGGWGNSSTNKGTTISGGGSNTSSAIYATIGGGFANLSSGQNSVVAGGNGNTASGVASGILGGQINVASCACSFIVGSGITSDRACTTFVNNLSIKSIPTSAPAQSGAVWRCTTDNTLRIVP